ncbi:succinate dehydrogenase cytochrome b subunit [Streptomyces aidingensis]|uniref:Succinate dehydrogenase / fumarate reductase cytochrome b subunit n=1 Tax=Streptomyces aidingensis TaxID=910347 RepID=A0A1I1LMW4_9ACTN|nr:succinate dehydrogenase cytochrome b subunit [Streptomyces aidingensis]SFC74454.1 succinate dehydrogenase / fumarate reductase cytochrome b subunit [Streptomyces aidingensis]
MALATRTGPERPAPAAAPAAAARNRTATPGPHPRPPSLAARPGSSLRLLWRSTIGKKAVMAVSGLFLLLYLVLHMLGNLKIFFGPDDFNGYSHWLRTLGEPALHHEWFLWLLRFALAAAVVLHGVCAYQLSRRARTARPVRYAHRPRGSSYATRTMRWGGVIVALFVVWHILDLTTGTVNPHGEAGQPYQNVVASFSTWYGNVIYLTAVTAVGLHVRHGLFGAAQTLGVNSPRRQAALRRTSDVLAVALTAGFVSVPLAVITGVAE